MIFSHPDETGIRYGRDRGKRMIGKVRKDRRVLVIVNWRLDGMEFPVLKSRYENSAIWGFRASWTPWNPSGIYSKLFYHWPFLFISGFLGFFMSRNYDVIITWHATSGLFMGMLFRICGKSRKRRKSGDAHLLVLNMIDVERKGTYGKLRRGFIRFCLGGVDRVTCYTHAEAERLTQHYSLPAGCSVCIPQCLQKRFFPDRPVPLDETEPYIFASGRSLRDYKTLFATIKDTLYPVKVVCQDHNIAGLEIPPNVEVHLNLYGKKVGAMRRAARLVVIPLQKEDTSAGQYDMLWGMGEGKGLIVTRTVASLEHMTDGKDALFVKCGDVEMLRRTIEELWNNEDRLRKLGWNAFQTMHDRFCFDSYERAVIKITEGLMD